jgi:16S rRNA processing protein RimM
VSEWESMVTVGRIVRPHGHRGAVVVAPETDFPEDRFRKGALLHWLRQGAAAPVRVVDGREFRGRWIVALDGVATMSEAEALRGVELRVAAEALRPLAAGAHYVHDLEGCAVVGVAGEVIGRATGVQFGSGAPLLVVADPRGGEVLVPMVEGIFRRVDVAARRIEIDPPAGLLDLNRTGGRSRTG